MHVIDASELVASVCVDHVHINPTATSQYRGHNEPSVSSHFARNCDPVAHRVIPRTLPVSEGPVLRN